MNHDKTYLRKKFLSKRKKKYLTIKNFNFNLIFSLIKKHFNKKKIIIAAYYPSNYEVDILNFLKVATKKKFKIALPVIRQSNLMNFRSWNFEDPLYVNKFGILEPKKTNKEIVPDLIMVPLAAFDNKLNRIGYGKGYYDRSLKRNYKIKNNTVSLGIAYSFQKCKTIPINEYDCKLDYIFTEQGIISSNN
jgi:5-formyltetrahydrofolate cyclo-ligase